MNIEKQICERYQNELKCKLVEQVYVHDVYEKLTADFTDERNKPWPRVEQFLRNLSPGSLVADIGCGNGQYLATNPHISVLGIDRCKTLLNSVQKDAANGFLARADCLSVPYRSNCFDAVICIGVIHHLVTARRQIKALNELCRIVRKGGQILLTAWAWEQPQRKFDGQNILVPRQISESHMTQQQKCSFCAPYDPVLIQERDTNPTKLENFFSKLSFLLKKFSNRKQIDQNSVFHPLEQTQTFVDIPIEFQVREFPGSSLFHSSKPKESGAQSDINKTKKMTQSQNSHLNSCPSRSRDERFYHVFKKGELVELIAHNVEELNVISCQYEAGNWCLLLEKL